MENIFIDLGSAFWHLLRPVLSALSPLLIGLTLAYLLNPLTERLRPRLGTGRAVFFTYTALLAALAALTGGFVVLITGALPTGGLQQTIASVTEYFDGAYRAAVAFAEEHLPAGALDEINLADGLREWIARRFSLESVASLLSAAVSGAVSLFLGIISSVYLLKDRDFFLMLRDRFLSLVLNQRAHGIVSEIMSEIDRVIMAFLKGALVDSIIVAFLSSAVLSVLRVDYAVIIGTLGGILNIIPYFGPFIGMIPAFLVAFFSDGLAKSIAAVVSLFLVQQIDSDFIYPHIVGNSTGLHPLFVLLSVSIFGYFFGLAGMILAVPTAGIIQVFVKRWAYR